MTEAAATPGPNAAALPGDIEAEVYERCFGAEPAAAIRALQERHKELGPAIDALARKVLRASELVGGLVRTAAMDNEPAQPPPERIGAYRIVRELGRGGFGIVYLAEQREPLQRVVALKVLRREAAGEVLQRFAAERKALATMAHAGIAHIYEAAQTEAGAPYFVMEYIDGAPITDFCDRRRLRIAERLRLFVDVGAAVLHAHQRGVLHRDLKPANILVVERDGQPLPKIIDFGLAKTLRPDSTLGHAGATIEGRLLGTPEYMAPEQAAGRAVDTRADIYALGVVLFELLTGTLPFPSATLRADGLTSVVRTLAEIDAPRLASAVKASAEAPGFARRRAPSCSAPCRATSTRSSRTACARIPRSGIRASPTWSPTSAAFSPTSRSRFARSGSPTPCAS